MQTAPETGVAALGVRLAQDLRRTGCSCPASPLQSIHAVAFFWATKRNGAAVHGGGCIGCIPFGCLTGMLLLAGAAALLLML